jgi:hypothetical protein
LYHISNKFPKGFSKSCEDKVFFKENVKSRGCNSLKKYWTGLPLQNAYVHNVISLCTKFHQNTSKGLGGVAKTKYFSKKILSPGAVTPWKIIGQGSP